MAGTIPGAGITTPLTLTTADNLDQLTLVSTDADANTGPILKLLRDSGSPADNDLCAVIKLNGDNDANEDTQCYEIRAGWNDVSNGTEDGAVRHALMVGGTLSDIMTLDSTIVVFNDASNDIDFRVESNNNTHQFFVDAGNDKIGINTSSPSATLEIHTENNVTAFETQPIVNQTYYAALFRNSSGNDVGQIESTASSTTFATSSDYRLKENVDYTWDATTRLKQLKPARFNFIIDETNTLQDGFIAHEVSSIVPEAISGEKDATYEDGKIKPQSIDQSKLVPLLVKTVQELEARIKTLEDA